jgi:N-acetylglutamate synthase-like GNAT family acetyltransferase
MKIQAITPADIPWVESTVSKYFGSPRVVSKGVIHHSAWMPGFIAEEELCRVGLVQYRIVNDECEVVVLISLRKREGIGQVLLHAVEFVAAEEGCKRMWVVTTNNNKVAMEFYRSSGWKQIAVHEGAVAEARKLKPEIPLNDENGTPIEDEIEFEYELMSD